MLKVTADKPEGGEVRSSLVVVELLKLEE